MPITNNVIIKLNEITALVEDKSKLSELEVDEIKSIFKTLVENGERYDVDEIEFWFKNEGSWKSKESRIRITNLSNYIQDKYQPTAHLRVISDDDSNCGDSISNCSNNRPTIFEFSDLSLRISLRRVSFLLSFLIN